MTRVLTVNAGSSSLKLSLVEGDDATLAGRELPAPGGSVDESELAAALGQGLAEADAVGHRIVHGGERFRGPVLLEPKVEAALRELASLAPLHQAKSLAALDAVSRALPGVPAVACFDTAFHATLPPAAYTYALPRAWERRWEVRRYGFHGLSHAWVARRVPELLERPGDGLRIVSCHLGAGASLCAIAGGHSIDTTMGFTPLEGLVMATRSGSVDPGLVLWLLEPARLSGQELGQALEHESGLLGLTGSADMREVLDRAAGGDAMAQLGVDVYVHRLRQAIGAMGAVLGGVDALAFTGGVGERASEIRERALRGLGLVDAQLDPELNGRAQGDTLISAPDSGVAVAVVRAREDLEIARQVRGVLERQRAHESP